MDIEKIKQLIDAVNTSELAFFEFSSSEYHVKMDKSLTRNSKEAEDVVPKQSKITPVDKIVEETTVVKRVETEETLIATDSETLVMEDLKVIGSPMVGTIYNAPSPEAEVFVEVGQRIKTGEILCIIEAMKLMNEIEAEVSGEVVEILFKNGDMVEYGQPLFKIREN
ncbi:acetyl-CoA carboxylase biotin carboxyl carrier protein [Clostridium cellulovorans]|uniref:Biotin carboxyl carrier protein of acetyl-CoA carboxylase n=1 Tax=Clostridium cellulovorans (strain ATCC 35296 / DSM 3052 / OCM 3 / 743B) TaxID=573061 RepID=D9SME3_CLOC7|nr:acetyl-CoA carboxylase biotin carboxyl carrier protein [Clostridium cellulovorans]ADL53799.1 acetyl-CoA carboxylase, biotin carboxyl carrier protein [Clostridium cellulovorans 743B]